MVDHRELFEDVTATLAGAGFDTARGPSGLRVGHWPQGVVVGWPSREEPAAGEDPPARLPAEGIRAAVSGAVAAVLRESGYRVADAGGDAVLVTAGPERAAAEPADPQGETASGPEQWWG
ncbi:hypothetical protein [Kitasatospora sp. NPDC088351]|uniref:hypothetical protein n=1 Tax=unclassified Kitasatospora TaxID=2633591 RepID=UPI00341873F0